jgi:phage replication initiation protein
MSKTLSPDAQAYQDAKDGLLSVARSIKAQVYGAGKPPAASAVKRSAPTPQAGYPTESAADAVEFSPINNMGENLVGERETVDGVELVMTDSGKVKIHMLKRPANENVCIIDWLNFTVLEDTWFRTAREHMISNDEIVIEASRHLEKIFGFGITAKRETGMNFYKESWVLGDDMGFVCFGGQRATMLITLNGQGCTNAVEGWQARLYDFLTRTAIRPSISRIDLAHDDIEGKYLSVDWAEAQWSVGGYTARAGGRAPSIECVGNWHRPSGAGRTLYIGTRTSGKFCRFYEKGKKEGDATSSWCRAEVEFKSSDRILPLEMLVRPSEYFAGAYPCFSVFAHFPTVRRLEIKQKTAQVVIGKAIDTTRHQFGKYLRVFRDVYGDKEALDLVCNPDKQAWPKRLKSLTSTVATGLLPIHETMTIPVIPDFINFIKAVPSFGLNGTNCHA